MNEFNLYCYFIMSVENTHCNRGGKRSRKCRQNKKKHTRKCKKSRKGKSRKNRGKSQSINRIHKGGLFAGNKISEDEYTNKSQEIVNTKPTDLSFDEDEKKIQIYLAKVDAYLRAQSTIFACAPLKVTTFSSEYAKCEKLKIEAYQYRLHIGEQLLNEYDGDNNDESIKNLSEKLDKPLDIDNKLKTDIQ